VEIDESRGKRFSAWAVESVFGCDGCGSLGQVVGAQGVLTQPEWDRGRKLTLACRCATSAKRN